MKGWVPVMLGPAQGRGSLVTMPAMMASLDLSGVGGAVGLSVLLERLKDPENISLTGESVVFISLLSQSGKSGLVGHLTLAPNSQSGHPTP